MSKKTTAADELIKYIINLTPEQAEKVLKHPAFVAVMDEYRSNKEKEYSDAV